jgi:hypothetical protein
MAPAREFRIHSHKNLSSSVTQSLKTLMILAASASTLVCVPSARAQLQQPLIFSPGGAVAVRNDQTGALTPVSGSPFPSATQSPFTLDVQGRFLFAPGNNSIHMFQITDSTTGAYQEVEPGSPFASTFTSDPVFIGVEPTGNYIAVVNRNGQAAGESSIETFQIQTSPPALVPVANSFMELDSTPIGFSQPFNAKSFHLYLGPGFPSSPTTPVGEELDTFSIDPLSGLLQTLANTPDNSTARCFAADPQGRFVVTGRGEFEGQILTTGIDGSFPSGFLSLGSDVFPVQLYVDSTGTFIYATYPAAPNPAAAVHIFSVNSSTGAIAETSSSPLPGFTAIPQLSPDPTGPFNYGSDPQPSIVHALTVDPVTGYFVEALGSPYTVTGILFPLTFGVPPGQQGISGPSVSLSQTSLSFGNIQTNSSSAPPQIVSVQSNGGQALSLNSITLSGAASSQFTESDTCHAPTVIQPGNFCSISLTFAPTALGLQQANVLLGDNAPGSPQTVALSGTGVAPPPPAPAVTVSPNPVSFPTITQGTVSNPINVTVTNSGTAVLNITSVAIGGNNVTDFTTTNTSCTGTIAVKAACTITVTFAPLAAGERTETITLTDNASDSPQAINVGGNANPAVIIGAAPSGSTSATISAGQTAQYNLQINPGAAYTGTVSLTYTGAPLGATIQGPATLQIANGNAAPFMVSVTTSGGGGASARLPLSETPRYMPLPVPRVTAGLTLDVILLLSLVIFAKRHSHTPPRQPAFSRAYRAIVFSVMFGAISGASGCGGGTAAITTPPQIVTPQGQSKISVTPSAMSAEGKPLQLQPIQLTLTVN